MMFDTIVVSINFYDRTYIGGMGSEQRDPNSVSEGACRRRCQGWRAARYHPQGIFGAFVSGVAAIVSVCCFVSLFFAGAVVLVSVADVVICFVVLLSF